MTLHMLRLDPDPLLFAQWATREGLLPAGADPGYAWHAILRAAFGDLAPKPFRVVERSGQRDRSGRRDYLVGYGTSAASALTEHAAAFADPAVAAAINLSSLAVKRMPETFAPGTRLGFEVRVRPVIRQDADGNRRKSRERDAFLVAIDGLDPAERVDREQVYRDWLGERLSAAGARLGSVKAVSLRRSRVLRRGADRKIRRVDGPDVILTGVLEVIEPEPFVGLLAHGVGRHRAFGFGMLLLAPPGG